MEPTTAILVGAFVLGLTGQSEPQDAFHGCETVDMGGYLNFADPTCMPGSGPNYTSVTYDILDPVTGDVIGTITQDVALDNK